MTYCVIVEPEALQDLISIYNFISKNDSHNKATNFIRELEHSIGLLSKMPLRCRKSYYIEDELNEGHDL